MSDGREDDFERVFGESGIWAELLRRSKQYLGTTLRKQSKVERRYKVLDYWHSHEGFEEFRERYQTDCERFSLLVASEGLIEQEVFLGSFYTSGTDWDEGTDLVPI